MSNKKQALAIVVDSSYGSVSADELAVVRRCYEQANIEFRIADYADEDELIANCIDADILLGTGNPPISRRVIEALPKLKFVQRFGIGVNSVDLEAATEHGVVVFNLPGFCVEELADLACAMIMGLIRNVSYYDRAVRRGEWPKCRYMLPGNIREMTLGIYGLGGAGRNLCDIFHKGYGCKILACDPFANEELAANHGCTLVDFDTMLRESDIISVHAPLTKETYHCFDRESFRKMKPTAMIINTARGGLIDENDLIWALETGEISYAGIDTFEQEPVSKDSPLLKMENVLLSPHSGSYGATAKKEQLRMVCQLVPDAVQNRKISLRNVANHGILQKIKNMYTCI